jgi:hypothetical protein
MGCTGAGIRYGPVICQAGKGCCVPWERAPGGARAATGAGAWGVPVGMGQGSLHWSVRVLLLVVALAGVAASARWTVQGFEVWGEYRAARPCPANQGYDCLSREAARVAGKHVEVSTTTDGDGHSNTTYHPQVTFRRVSGDTESFSVDNDFYRVSDKGDPAGLTLWRGQVVKVEVDDRTHHADTFLTLYATFRALPGWAALGLAPWAWRNGRPRDLLSMGTGAWLFLGAWQAPLVTLLVHSIATGGSMWVRVVSVGLMVVGLGALGWFGYEASRGRDSLWKRVVSHGGSRRW